MTQELLPSSKILPKNIALNITHLILNPGCKVPLVENATTTYPLESDTSVLDTKLPNSGI